jgi:hypothetical protein
LDAEAGAAGMSVVIPTAGSYDLDLIVVPVTGDVFGQGDAVTALPKLCGKVQVIGSQESSGETLMA